MIILHRIVSNVAITVFYLRLLCLPFLLLNRLEFVFQFCLCCLYFPFIFPFISLFCLYICCFVLRRNEVCLRPRRQSLWLRPKATPIVPIPPYIPLELFSHFDVCIWQFIHLFLHLYSSKAKFYSLSHSRPTLRNSNSTLGIPYIQTMPCTSMHVLFCNL